MRAVVLFESLTGHTRRLAELLGGAIKATAGSGGLPPGETVDVSVRPVNAFDFRELADADIVFVGSWTDGLIFFGQRPGRAGRIWKLPTLDHKPVALFGTYAIDPKKMLPRLQEILEAKGAKVVASHAFKRNRLEEGVDEFVAEALAAVRTAAS